MDRIFVLIADGQPLFSEALASALENYPELAVLEDRPSSSEGSLDAIARQRPDVALIDYWIPGAWSPADLVEEVARAGQATKVLLMSWLYSTAEIHAMLEGGAVGFLPKSVMVSDVAKAIRLAYSGVCPVFGEELQGLTEKVDSRKQGPGHAADRLKDLTQRELGILLLLASGLSSKEMAERLSLSPATTRTHVGNLLKKTGCSSQVELVALARNYGMLQI